MDPTMPPASAPVAELARELRWRPDTPQTFADQEDRRRLTPTTVLALINLARHWRLTGDEAAALLATSPPTWDRMKRAGPAWSRPLNQDQMLRASALIGTFKGLHLLFASAETADTWPRRPNAGPLFTGRTPIAAMIEGGIPTLLDIRQHVDSLRGGL